jgi:hypothetical protein
MKIPAGSGIPGHLAAADCLRHSCALRQHAITIMAGRVPQERPNGPAPGMPASSLISSRLKHLPAAIPPDREEARQASR